MNVICLQYNTEARIIDSFKSVIIYILLELENEYPLFNDWLNKVFYEVKFSHCRKILIAYNSNYDDIIGISILKDTIEEKKICTFRIMPEYRRKGFGTMLLEKSCKVLNTPFPLITVSGTIMNQFGPFLKKRGFVIKDKVKSIYKRGCYEYFFNKPYQHKTVLLSIKPEYASRIEDGLKKIEFRKRIFANSIEKCYVYSSFPVKRIIGYFLITNIIDSTIDELWNRYSDIGFISKDKFYDYYSGHKNGFGILINEFIKIPYINPTDFDTSFRAPQSYCYIDNVEFLNWLEIKSDNI